jgi:hypothetical protein
MDENVADMSKKNPYDYGHAVGMPVQQQRQRPTSLPTPSPSPGTTVMYPSEHSGGMIREYLEVYDYHSTGVRFRSFVAEQGASRALFVFFDRDGTGLEAWVSILIDDQYREPLLTYSFFTALPPSSSLQVPTASTAIS